jgi:hypothetical protein
MAEGLWGILVLSHPVLHSADVVMLLLLQPFVYCNLFKCLQTWREMNLRRTV